MSDQKLERSVPKWPVRVNNYAWFICVLFSFSMFANFIFAMEFCAESGKAEAYSSAYRAELKKNEKLQQELYNHLQPDAVSSASDGDPPPIVADQTRNFENDVSVCAEHLAQVLSFSPFVLSTTTYYTLQTWEFLRSVTENNICYRDWTVRIVSSFVFPTCMVMVENKHLDYYNWCASRFFRWPY